MQNSIVIGIIIFSSCFDASDTESKLVTFYFYCLLVNRRLYYLYPVYHVTSKIII